MDDGLVGGGRGYLRTHFGIGHPQLPILHSHIDFSHQPLGQS